MGPTSGLYWQSLTPGAYRGALWWWCVKPHSSQPGGRAHLRQDLAGPMPAHAEAGQPDACADVGGHVSHTTCDDARFVSG